MNLDSVIAPQPTIDETRDWSPYQRDIFNAVANLSSNVIVEAVAGSGKTTTLIEAINHYKLANPSGEVMVLAFNKSIATELQQRVPYGVEAKTFHSLGLSTFRGRRPKVKSYKLRQPLKQIMPSKLYEEHASDILRMISLAKANAILNPDPDAWEAALDAFEINCPLDLEEHFIKWAHKLWQAGLEIEDEIDFDDMLFLPILRNFPFPQYDLVLVDEAQDLSPIQHEIVLRLLKPDGRVVAVGDTHQAIYGFRGADHNSMNRFRQQFSMLELPLSISYRCPRRVVEEAQKYVPHIQWADSAIPGDVEYYDFLEDISSFTRDDLVICRNNAPLFRLAMRFIQERRPVNVRGNFGDQLISFVKSFKTKEINVFNIRLKQWFETEQDRLLSRDQVTKAGILKDKYDSIRAVAEHSSSVAELIDILVKLFEPGRGTTLSSIHRAKGGEAKHVHFYLPSLLPSKYAQTRAQLLQENNLSYVGITRSLSTLTYIEGE